jgi:hypothetical protein
METLARILAYAALALLIGAPAAIYMLTVCYQLYWHCRVALRRYKDKVKHHRK